MVIKFGRVFVSGYVGFDACRWLPVTIDGKGMGECYREEGMDEWCASIELRERYGEDFACGYSNANAFKAAIRREANELDTETAV